MRVVLCGAGLALAGHVVAQGKITGVETRQVGDSLKLQVVGEGLKKPKTLRGKDGKSFILEFQASLKTRSQKVLVYEGGLKAFKYVLYKSKPSLVRVQYWPEEKIQPKVIKNVDGYFVTWAVPTKANSTQVNVPSKNAEAKPSEALPIKTEELVSDSIWMLKVPTSTGEKKTVAPPKVKPTAVVEKPATKPTTKPTTPVTPKVKKVSLDFVNTDVVQILRALAIQSNVNIVTSPDVKGNLSVSLANVTVSEALDLVTTLTGLAYQMVGKTYIVAAKDKIIDMVGDLERTGPRVVTSNVVAIYSGEGTHIKAAILRTLPPQTEDGSFEIMLPSEETKVEKKTEDKAAAEKSDKSDNDKAETKVESKATTGVKDLYVVVMGSPERVDEVSKMVRKLDQQFCENLGLDLPKSTAMVRKSYQVRGGSAADLAKAVAGDEKKIGNVEISATPAASKSEQVIVLYGRENEVDKLMATLSDLDSSEQVGDQFRMYDVRFADPRALREALVAQVPGLRVSIPPASAGNPRLFETGAAKIQAADRMKDPNDPGVSGSTNGNEVDPRVTRENGAVNEGLTQPFNDLERAAVPMRLLLRGTADQVRAAEEYLTFVDIAPKQVALELRVMELSKEDALRIGIDWNIFTGGAVSLIRLNQSFPTTQSNTGNIRISGSNFGADITATLDSIADKQRLIARPNLLAIDGRESEIFVGDIVRYVSSRSINPTTGEVNLTIDQVPVGVRLAVMPRVGANGSLTMDLRPVVSSIVGFLNAGPGVEIPQTSSRIAQSTVSIQSGETIAIGGLIQDIDTKNVSKVPFLGDLPIIGQLFRRTDHSRVRREVVFFLTARQVSESDRMNAADPRDAEGKIPAEVPPLKKNGGL